MGAFFAGLDSPPGVALNIELGGTGGAACERIKKRGVFSQTPVTVYKEISVAKWPCPD